MDQEREKLRLMAERAAIDAAIETLRMELAIRKAKAERDTMHAMHVVLTAQRYCQRSVRFIPERDN